MIKAVAGWLTIQPDYSPPSPSARMILEAYPKLEAMLAEAKKDSLGYLSWPAILKSVERVVSEMDDV
jgi:hypothetical protein